ncbi:MAG: hypothetical protein HC881_04270 [Leptolyngbyaceae cyanobacterium SL_7_1]|nr:hypothetical protein [Leptolyngbyaceae cyanobacterium SL_7_1]
MLLSGRNGSASANAAFPFQPFLSSVTVLPMTSAEMQVLAPSHAIPHTKDGVPAPRKWWEFFTF